QHHAADQLDVEVAHAERPLGRLADAGERLGKKLVELLSFLEPAAELVGLRAQLVVGKCLDRGLEIVDLADAVLHALEGPALAGPEDLLEDAHPEGWYRTGPRASAARRAVSPAPPSGQRGRGLDAARRQPHLPPEELAVGRARARTAAAVGVLREPQMHEMVDVLGDLLLERVRLVPLRRHDVRQVVDRRGVALVETAEDVVLPRKTVDAA